jgi:hypothetical protein
MTVEVMTTYDEANKILDIFNANGVNNIQMLLHGWFNGGINHDVAKNVRMIKGLGSRRQMQSLNARLQEHGGALSPSVNFALTNTHTGNFSASFEAAKTITGITGITSRVARDMLTTWSNQYSNDWFYLVNPVVIPDHVDEFIPAYKRGAGIDSLTLNDLGDILTESLYARGAIDKEHSRLVAAEQMGRLRDEFPNLVVSGGNDYAIEHASHLVGVPTSMDWYYIFDHEVPFYQMVMHGYIEYAGDPVNLQANPNPQADFLNSMATGASPRYIMTYQQSRLFQYSPHDRMYTTHYINWIDTAIEYYNAYNEVYRNLRTERIVDFIILTGGPRDNVTVTVFSGGTRIYVNNTRHPYEADGIYIPPYDFAVSAG